MPRSGLNGIIGWLRRSVLAHVSCGELLERFIARSQPFGAPNDDSRHAKADDAFAELVRRHGPKVYGVCRRILGDHQLAEDAFQAAFVVLSRKASSIHPRSAVGGYLYVVARQAALKALAVSRRRKETLVARLPEAFASGAPSHESDVLAMLDEEIANLKDAHRAAVVLCELDGVGRAEAAKQLGISEGTLSSRLSRAREQLRKRLSKRGVSLSAGMLAALAGSAQAAVPLGLMAVAEQITTNAVSQSASLVARGVLQAMILTKVKTVTMLGAALLLASGLVFGLAAARDGLPGPQAKQIRNEERPLAVAAEPAPPKQAEVAQPNLDPHGDPLPEYAVQRIGTNRFRPSGLVHACAYSPDGKYLVAGTDKYGIALFDAADGRLVRRFRDNGPFTACAFSPNGAFVIAASDGSIFRWDLSTGELVRVINTTQRQIWSLAFTPDGNRLISAGEDKSLLLWDIATEKELVNFEGHEGPVRSVAITSDGRYVVSGSADMTARLWDIATGKMLREFTGRKVTQRRSNEYVPVALSHDGKWLAAPDGQPGICIYEVATGRLECRLPSTQVDFYALAFSHDGKLVAAGTNIHQFFVWDVATHELKQQRAGWRGTSYRGWHWGGVPCVAFSPDDTRIAFAEDSRVALWDLAKGQELEPADLSAGAIRRLRFASDSQSFAAFSDDPRVGLTQWEVDTGKLSRRLRGEASWSDNFDLSEDLQLLVSSGNEHLRFWDTTTGQEVRKVKLSLESNSVSLQPLRLSADGN